MGGGGGGGGGGVGRYAIPDSGSKNREGSLFQRSEEKNEELSAERCQESAAS